MLISKKLVLLTLLLVAGNSVAQDITHPMTRVPGCTRLNSSRIDADECGRVTGEPVVITHELESSQHIALPQIEALDCRAEISIQYLQSNAVAKVEGTIENETCAASSGSFVVSIRTLDDNNATKTQEFPETWQRDDDQSVSFSYEYEIGANVDLVRVRTLRPQCSCTTSTQTGP